MEKKKKILGLLALGLFWGSLMGWGLHWTWHNSFIVKTTRWDDQHLKVKLKPATEYKLFLKRVKINEKAVLDESPPGYQVKIFYDEGQGREKYPVLSEAQWFLMNETYTWKFSTEDKGRYVLVLYIPGLKTFQRFNKFRIKIREMTTLRENCFILGGVLDLVVTSVGIYLVLENRRDPITQEKARLHSKTYRETYINNHKDRKTYENRKKKR